MRIFSCLLTTIIILAPSAHGGPKKRQKQDDKPNVPSPDDNPTHSQSEGFGMQKIITDPTLISLERWQSFDQDF